MTIKKGLIALILCILTSMALQAQIALNLTDIVGQQGQTVEVDVNVSGFSDVTSMQFSINWDSTILDFRSVGNLTDLLPGFTTNEIGIVDVAAGAIRVAWFDNTISGISTPDDTNLFTLTFELIGGAGTNSSITISDTPIVIEFTALDGSTIELEAVNGGTISIPGNTTSTTFLTAPNGMELYQNEPNPFYTVTTIKAILPTAEDVQFFITDVSGRIVYQNNFKSVQGENTIEIKSDLLVTSGNYYYTLQNERYQLSRKLILLP